jgi:hypothetical protein
VLYKTDHVAQQVWLREFEKTDVSSLFSSTGGICLLFVCSGRDISVTRNRWECSGGGSLGDAAY